MYLYRCDIIGIKLIMLYLHSDFSMDFLKRYRSFAKTFAPWNGYNYVFFYNWKANKLKTRVT